jgi:hypothetical protein
MIQKIAPLLEATIREMATMGIKQSFNGIGTV